ncbi:MAG: hypothetical protein KJ569_06370 [Candidatus Omnitrophica bacterium]|nr:hypothetical protein [Candidatus Omnitrophota bacterium]MBU1134518.1 hypothetical protein [Candidatus Omnitrophota bacterium]MBU1810827.1 hypothetical protein [Candidatus Omnitrophota bacterium]
MKVNVELQEPNRKKKIKRIIAREGLIFIGIAGISVVLFINGHGIENYGTWRREISDWAGPLIVFGYPIYLLIRFIIWAVRTLKEK